MTSREKLRNYFDQAAASPDSELQQAIPFGVPAGIMRMALAQAEEQLPNTAQELDELIDRGIEFLRTLRSDPEALSA